MRQSRYPKQTERTFILILSLIFLVLTFFVIKDIFSIIIYSAILSYFLFPIHKYYLKKTKKESLSAILTLASATIGILLPLTILFFFLVLSLLKVVAEYQEYIKNPEILNSVLESTLEKITNSQTLSGFDYSGIITAVVKKILEFSQNFFQSTPKALLSLFILLFITYYILVHHKTIFRAANEYLPLSLRKQNEITSNIQKNISVLFKGYFLTGIAQTLVALFGYIVFSVPNILILTFLTLITSLIPYLGTLLIWVPAGIYLIIIGNEIAGIGLLIYGTIVISAVDNFLRPYLMSNKDTIAPPLVFVGFVGGMIAFGLQGIILGPILISITAILLKYLTQSYEQKN